MLSHFSCFRLFVILWTVAHQVRVSMGFFRQEYWNGLPCPPPGDLADPGIEPTSLMFPALAGRFLNTSTTWEAIEILSIKCPNLTPQDGKNPTLPSPQSGWWTYFSKTLLSLFAQLELCNLKKIKIFYF